MTEKAITPHLVVQLLKKTTWIDMLDYHIAAHDDRGTNSAYVDAIIREFHDQLAVSGNKTFRILYYEATKMRLSSGEFRERRVNETVMAGPSCRNEGTIEDHTDENGDKRYELNKLLPMSDELKAKFPQAEKDSLVRAAVEATFAPVDPDAEAKPADPTKVDEDEDEEEEGPQILPGDTIVAYDSQGNAIEFSIPE